MKRHPSWFENPLSDLDEFIESASRHLEGRSLEFACRAVYHEISCLFEREIQQAAYNSYRPDTDVPVAGDPESTVGAQLRTLVPQVEAGIGGKLDDLDGGQTIREVRRMANNFKHEQGLADPGGPVPGGFRLPSYHAVGVESATSAIAAARLFFHDLWRRVESR